MLFNLEVDPRLATIRTGESVCGAKFEGLIAVSC